MNPNELKAALGSGLLSFPVTTFNADLSFDEDAYREHITWLDGFGASVLFAPGGTGELFSLTQAEAADVTWVAKATSKNTPIVGGAAYGTAMAVEMAKAAEAVGADRVLLLPAEAESDPAFALFLPIGTCQERDPPHTLSH